MKNIVTGLFLFLFILIVPYLVLSFSYFCIFTFLLIFYYILFLLYSYKVPLLFLKKFSLQELSSKKIIYFVKQASYEKGGKCPELFINKDLEKPMALGVSPNDYCIILGQKYIENSTDEKIYSDLEKVIENVESKGIYRRGLYYHLFIMSFIKKFNKRKDSTTLFYKTIKTINYHFKTVANFLVGEKI